MIQLFCNGELLDIPNDFKCTLTLKNPIFQKELESAFVYDINLPLTNRNKKILLNYANRISTANKYLQSRIEIFFNGLKFVEGTFVYTGRVNTISGSIGIGQGDFLYSAYKKYLDQVDYGEKIFADNTEALAYFNNLVDKTYPEVEFVLPYTIGYTDHCYLPDGTTGYYQKDHLNFYEPGVGYKITLGTNKAILVPHFFLQYVLKKLFAGFGYELIDKWLFEDTDYSRLIIFNTYNANGGIPNEGSKVGYESDILKIRYNNHLPHVFISDFLSGLQNHINARFLFNHINKKATIIDPKKVLLDPSYIDITGRFIRLTGFELKQSKGFSLQIGTDDTDAWQQQYVEQQNFLMDLFGGSLDTIYDLPAKPIGFKYYYINDIQKLYVWAEYWEQWVEAYWWIKNKFFTGEQEHSISSSTGTCEPDDGRIILTGFGNPAIDYRKISPRILFYNGMVEDVGNYYPASRKFRGDLSLDFDNSKLYKDRWEIYLDKLLSTKVITGQVLFSPVDIKDFDFSRKYRINGVDYLVKEIKVPIGKYSIGVCTIEAAKI